MIGQPVPRNRWDLVATRSGKPTISIIVPHYDQQDDLDRLLAALAGQRNANIADIVIVDDGSPTRPSVPDRLRGTPVITLAQDDLGVRPAAARNLGVTHSAGDVLVFFDADTLPGPDAVARLAQLPHDTDEALTVGRRFHVDLEGWEPERVQAWLFAKDSEPASFTDPQWLQDLYSSTVDLSIGGPHTYQGIIGAAMALRRTFFNEIGGFDDAIDCYGGEDWDLAHRAWNGGGLLAHIGDAHVFHNGPDWAERNGWRGLKNDERIVLQHRIPSLDDPVRAAVPSVVVHLRNRTWPWAHTVACVASILGELGPTVDVVIDAEHPGILAATAADQRVTTASPARLRGCLANLEIEQPIDFEPGAVLSLVRRVITDTDSGRVRVDSSSGRLLEVTSTRALARATRWAIRLHQPTDRLLADLFGIEDIPASSAGIDTISERVDLSMTFPR